MCLKTYYITPWPNLIFENDVSMTPVKRPTFAERIVTSPFMHTNYLTTRDYVSGKSILLKVNFLAILQLFLSRYQLQLKTAETHTNYKY